MGGGEQFPFQTTRQKNPREGTFQSKQYSLMPLPLSPHSLQALLPVQARRNAAGLRGCGHTLILAVTTVASKSVGLGEQERKGQKESRTASVFSISECAYSAP